ncbi:hypothetical protein V8E36_001690 [Tilletia maclaganii]
MGFLYNALRGSIHIARLGFIYIARMGLSAPLSTSGSTPAPTTAVPLCPPTVPPVPPVSSAPPPSASPGLVLFKLLRPTPLDSPYRPAPLRAPFLRHLCFFRPRTPTTALLATAAADAPRPRCDAQAAPIRADLPPTPICGGPTAGNPHLLSTIIFDSQCRSLEWDFCIARYNKLGAACWLNAGK